jgi:NAD(P)-dependent dehydrogenase (short-subunit alcohol dehydrogenase family)
MDLHLTGLRALVTGGTKGIGRAIVDTLVDEGAAVSFCARTESEVSARVDSLTSYGHRAVGRAVDVADGDALQRWVDESAAELGGVDVVVANVSALAIPDTEDNWKASFDVDLMGTVRLVQAALPHLDSSRAPSIVTISSVSGREIDFAAGPYGTIKAAVVHYTQGLANQLASRGIRANTVSPGNVYFEGGVWGNMERDRPEFFEHALSLNPTGRMARPEEVARAAAFLASPAASFTSGTNLLVDGALTRGVQL